LLRSFAAQREREKNPKGKQLDWMGSLREPGNSRSWPVELRILRREWRRAAAKIVSA
jgi:hypothetical protein